MWSSSRISLYDVVYASVLNSLDFYNDAARQRFLQRFYVDGLQRT